MDGRTDRRTHWTTKIPVGADGDLVQNGEQNGSSRDVHGSISQIDTVLSCSSVGSYFTWTLFQYQIRRLTVRARKVSSSWDLYLALLDRSAIWQAPRRYYNSNCGNTIYLSYTHSTLVILQTSRFIELNVLRVKTHDTFALPTKPDTI